MRISIIGTGYVGLVTGVGLASLGHKVICVDIDKEKIKRINKGHSPIYEKGLPLLLKKVLKEEKFLATADLKSAVLTSEITFIAAPTPGRKQGVIDLSYVKKIARDIGSLLGLKTDYHTVVVKSTVAPETCSKIILPIIKKWSGKASGEFGFCANPEFLREGKALSDFLNPDRIIIGELDKKSGDTLLKAYKSFNTDIFRTSLENAEMIKYASNAFLSVLISFANETADICEKIPGASIFEVLAAHYLDKRLNPIINGKRVNPEILSYIYPGAGFGGSCLPKDINALISFSRGKAYNPKLLSAAVAVNKRRAKHIFSLLKKELKIVAGKKVAVLGLAFKPGTDDMRDSPSIPLIKELIRKKALVSVYDPVCNPKLTGESVFKNLDIEFCESMPKALRGKDACILMTRWDEFQKITPELLNKEMKNPLIVDGRGFLNPESFEGKAIYRGLGLI